MDLFVKISARCRCKIIPAPNTTVTWPNWPACTFVNNEVEEHYRHSTQIDGEVLAKNPAAGDFTDFGGGP